MSRRSIQLIIALLVAVIALATALDVFAPISEAGGGRMMTVFDLPFGRSLGRSGGSQLGAISLRAPLPRAVRSLAGVAALAGYGLLLRYLAAERLARLARALAASLRQLARHSVNGAAALLLITSLILLASLSVIAVPLVPLLGIGLAATTLSGLVALALPLGQQLRSRAGALEPAMVADLLSGLLAIVLVALIPYIGVLALAFGGLAGLGAAATTRLGTAERPVIETLDY